MKKHCSLLKKNYPHIVKPKKVCSLGIELGDYISIYLRWVRVKQDGQ